jgi:hypothetical protein
MSEFGVPGVKSFVKHIQSGGRGWDPGRAPTATTAARRPGEMSQTAVSPDAIPGTTAEEERLRRLRRSGAAILGGGLDDADLLGGG